MPEIDADGLRPSTLDEHIEARRAHVGAMTGDRLPAAHRPVGLAFSGGGIRSATISLGIAQALARRGRFYAFDYVSTVSGGGYFGSFLRSLFLPTALRGDVDDIDQNETESAIATRFAYADKVLKDGPNARIADDAGVLGKHPIWWLRENGRYLAPNGAADFAVAISYIVRNWIAMLYVFALAFAVLFVLLNSLVAGLLDEFPGHVLFSPILIGDGKLAISPLFRPALVLVIVSAGIGAGYWLTERMAYNPERGENQHVRFLGVWATTAGAFGIGVALATGGFALIGHAAWLRQLWPDGAAFIASMAVDALPVLAQQGLVAGTFMMGVALLSALVVYLAEARTARNPTPPLRRALLRWTTIANQWAAAIAAIAAIDSFAVALRAGELGWTPGDGPGAIFSILIYPALAIIIKKLPEWAGDGQGRIVKWLGAHISVVALCAGSLLFGSLAIAVGTVAHMAMWTGAAWSGVPDWPTWAVFALVTLTLATMTGLSGGFINLSSLHALYASRLTRAYLGASNAQRLCLEKAVSEGHPDDQIDVEIYETATLAAPIHLINLTLNETRGDNMIVQRDRKGRRVTIDPVGIKIDEGENCWAFLNRSNAERLSVGQLCAISGAAASSGMGRRTSLGTALALTYANVRLGYWWDRGTFPLNIRDMRGEATVVETRFAHRLWNRIAETFIYLFNEMTARYSRDYRRYYLTDGGHSENSGALELLRRGCGFILVADNGEDGKFTFSDLEIFIRTARTDLGYEIRAATYDETVEYVGDQESAKHFFNYGRDGWRKAARAEGGKGFALLLYAYKIDGSGTQSEIVWLKPRLFDGLSSDLATYAEENPPFPQQSTGDQFFDEAQWESYRRIGFEMAGRLFKRRGAFPALPIIGDPLAGAPRPRRAKRTGA